MSAVADRVSAEIALTEAELAEALEKRAALALRVFGSDDDDDAKKKLSALADYIIVLERRLDLAALAVAEAEREERAAAEEADAAERARLESQAVRLEAELAVLIDDVQRGARVVGERAKAAVAVGDELARAKDALGAHRGRAVGPILGELVSIRIRDEAPALPLDRRPLAAERLALIAKFPLIEEPTDPIPQTGEGSGPVIPQAGEREGKATAKACTVCAHAEADAIRSALEAGEPLRSIEERYGVSRSALSRHNSHGVGLGTPRQVPE